MPPFSFSCIFLSPSFLTSSGMKRILVFISYLHLIPRILYLWERKNETEGRRTRKDAESISLLPLTKKSFILTKTTWKAAREEEVVEGWIIFAASPLPLLLPLVPKLPAFYALNAPAPTCIQIREYTVLSLSSSSPNFIPSPPFPLDGHSVVTFSKSRKYQSF